MNSIAYALWGLPIFWPNADKGLKDIVYLCVGAQVYLTRNLNTELGLFNSSPGVVKEIVYAEGSDPMHDLPEYVLVDFPNFKGSKTEGRNLFPVKPMTVLSDDF